MKLDREERLERRRNSPDYQRAQGHMALDFISEFIALSPPEVTTTERPAIEFDFDLWGLGHEGHFNWWAFAGMLVAAIAFSGFMAFARAGARAAHPVYKHTGAADQPSHACPPHSPRDTTFQ